MIQKVFPVTDERILVKAIHILQDKHFRFACVLYVCLYIYMCVCVCARVCVMFWKINWLYSFCFFYHLLLVRSYHLQNKSLMIQQQNQNFILT